MNQYLIVALGLAITGVLFIILTRARNYRKTVISKKYEEIRDKVTIRQEVPDEEHSTSGSIPMAKLASFLITGGIPLIMAVIFYKQIIGLLQQTTNVTELPVNIEVLGDIGLIGMVIIAAVGCFILVINLNFLGE